MSNDMQQGTFMLMKVIRPLVALKCPIVVIRNRIGLVIGLSNISHRDESFDISDTSLRNLEEHEIAGTLVTFKLSIFTINFVSQISMPKRQNFQKILFAC